MKHFHGTPVTPEEVAYKLFPGRHAIVSHANPQQIPLVAERCRSFGLDNGAWTDFSQGKPTDWDAYYKWVQQWASHPSCEWAIIPDVIDGDEAANDHLISVWPFQKIGMPVWHLHESTARLRSLALRFPLVALGSSGQYAQIGTPQWWKRMAEAMNSIALAGSDGRLLTKIHGLRMMDGRNPGTDRCVVERFPFTSVDSTNVARNIGYDQAWKGTYVPATKAMKALVLAERIEQSKSADRWIDYEAEYPRTGELELMP